MVKRSVCQYCHNEFDDDKHRRTAEHVIPKSVIDLFPEQYISYFNGKAIIDNNGLTISDVCGYCNNDLLSPLDNYGAALIKNQFLDTYSANQYDDSFEKMLNFNQLSRWILKIIYNERRSRRLDYSWFEYVLNYMLYGDMKKDTIFSLFAGIHINMAPLPEAAFEYFPMQIHEDPRLLGNSLGIALFRIDPYINQIKVEFAQHTYCIRFGNAVFYCILWEKNVPITIKTAYEQALRNQFNFVQLCSDNDIYNLKCISAHTNTTLGYNHLVSISGQAQDRLIVQAQLNGRTPEQVQAEFSAIFSHDNLKKGEALVEASRFPGNKKAKKKLEKYYKDK